jgi:hypothetical protein
MAMIRKGQAHQIGGRDMQAQTSFVAELFVSSLDRLSRAASFDQTQTSQQNRTGG